MFLFILKQQEQIVLQKGVLKRLTVYYHRKLIFTGASAVQAASAPPTAKLFWEKIM